MKLKTVQIQNYRSCRNVEIKFGALQALVGANNAGKSVILKALDFLFNPSTGKIDEETFWNGDTSLQIRIEAVFDELTDEEKDKLAPYLRLDDSFHMARSAIMSKERTETQGDSGNKKVVISSHYCKPMPSQLWLRESEVNGKCIKEWWGEKENLTIGETSFAEFVGNKKPTVSIWKSKASEFTQQYLTPDDFEDVWDDNPRGYAGVLKGTLPNFIYVPAVRDVSDEAKVTKTNPFGKLLAAIVAGIAQEQRKVLDRSLKTIQNKLNKKGGKKRLERIAQTEQRLNELLNDYMDCEFEIEFQTPTLETLLAAPRLFADDGFRNAVENKGHGLQRAVIFSILRCYSELISGYQEEKKRVNIFAIEEPEIYMHPQAQRTIRRVLLDVTDSGDQAVFSTHSFLLLDVARFDEIVRVEAVPCKHGRCRTVESRVWHLPMSKMIRDIETRRPNLKGKATDESMRELYSHAYHPIRSEGFFARKIILVEGATEHYSLPIYAEALKHHFDKLNISVVDCGGKGSMDRLYRVFNELGIPCYILFDYDAGNHDNNIIDKSRELLTMLGEQPHPPIDKVFISDQVACFQHKWEVDLADEIPDMEKLTREARQTLGLSAGSGKPLVARYIAKKLIESVPPNVPKTIRRIIEKAIEVEWQESCLVL